MQDERLPGGMPELGFEVIDPGHMFRLGTLDGRMEQVLTFVKRCDLTGSGEYPGNTNSYPGTTLQCVIRALISRVRYLDGQESCNENAEIIERLQECLTLLETRAAARHGRTYEGTWKEAAEGRVCAVCGHTECREHGTNKSKA